MLSDALNLDIPLMENITWQYEDATRLQSLINSKQIWYNSHVPAFAQAWMDQVFNLRNANQFGLVVWAAILNLPSSLVYDPNAGNEPFGFENRENFDNGNFDATHTEPAIPLDAARRMLRMRYWTQTISPTIVNINAALKDVFGDLGNAYVISDTPMSLKYKFDFTIDPLFLRAAQTHDIFPQGAGVTISFEHP